MKEHVEKERKDKETVRKGSKEGTMEERIRKELGNEKRKDA